jgi:type II secretory ATPase GspE/PulE/Tfp pilus assembly ATPase PilB-like protein
MPINLKPSDKRANSDQLNTISTIRQRRINRVRQDLDKAYGEYNTQTRAQQLGLPYIDLYGFPIDTNHLTLIPKHEAEANKIGVFVMRNNEVYFATPEPGFGNQKAILEKVKSKGHPIKIYLCSQASFEKLIKTYSFIVETKSFNTDIKVSNQAIDDASDSNQEDDLTSLSDQLQKVSMTEIVELVLAKAIKNKASDIHFEPEKETYNLRLRIDGVLHTFASLPISMLRPVEQRLKLISGLKLNVNDVPQDGRFSFQSGDKEIDVRVSMLPSNYGYSVVMRLLGTGNVALELKQLGFSGLAEKRVSYSLEKPQGMILTTGPTGSGKTTTLYTFIKELNNGEDKIITLEDPIEYKLPGISQTQIDASQGYTFGSGLKSILRQDPDVVMVGEIRDSETAETAVQAALTGHQVLSTVHTNDAAGAIPRLLELGIKGFLLADALSSIIGQRLVRRLCPHCKREETLSPEDQKIVIENLNKLNPENKSKVPNPLKFYTSDGCKECNNLGYKGRVGVYEVMTVTDGLRMMLTNQNPNTVEVRQMAMQEGMVSMMQDGILKCLDGQTDFKEVKRNVA